MLDLCAGLGLDLGYLDCVDVRKIGRNIPGVGDRAEDGLGWM